MPSHQIVAPRLEGPCPPKTVVLLSYPRSGNGWLRYITEALTGRPSLGIPGDPALDPPLYTRLKELKVDPDAVPAAVKRHELREMEEADAQRPLIVAVRNYKECIIRDRYWLEESNLPFDLGTQSRLYMDPIAYYTGHPGPKLLLFYEDFLDEPVGAVTGLARLLDVPEETCNRFLERYEEHRDRSIQDYPSHTLGRAKIYHSLTLSPVERRAWDRRVRELNPALYDRYLTRYREAD